MPLNSVHEAEGKITEHSPQSAEYKRTDQWHDKALNRFAAADLVPNERKTDMHFATTFHNSLNKWTLLFLTADGNFTVAFHKRTKDLRTSQEVPCCFLMAVTGEGMVLLTLVESATNNDIKRDVFGSRLRTVLYPLLRFCLLYPSKHNFL
jgi:hypothetical protein